jgi:hypothetical protein
MPSATQPLSLGQPAHYRICAQGMFDAGWLDMLSGVWMISSHNGASIAVTTLVGHVANQAALMGALETLYSLGYPILLVECLVEDDRMAR